MDNRYKKNIGSVFSPDLQDLCLSKTIAVIGAGGCGGYVLEHFARLGVKKIIIFDGDDFAYSNLNRQRFCNVENLYRNKAYCTKSDLIEINCSIEVVAVADYFSEKYLDIIFSNNVDIIIHAADCYINVEDLNKGLNKCLLRHIPIIKVALYESKATAAFINPKHLGLWFELKTASERQSISGPCEYISTLSHYCSFSANLALELFIAYLKNPEMTSRTLSYDYNTMQINICTCSSAG